MSRKRTFAAAPIFICLLGACPGDSALSADERPAKVDIFVSGTDGDHTYRIPAVIVTPTGTVLALCEGRKTSRSDHGGLDLLLRRSIDNGKTWQPTHVVYEEGGEKNAYERIISARFALKSLEENGEASVVTEIGGFMPPRAVRLPGFRGTKPTLIEDRDALTKVFGETEAEKIAKQVDFDKEFLVFFQWAGSGQDKLNSTVEKKDGKTKIVFVFKPGRTRDLRPHAHLFSIRKGVSWEIAE